MTRLMLLSPCATAAETARPSGMKTGMESCKIAAMEIAPISRDRPAVPAIMGQLSATRRPPRMDAAISGSHTSNPIG
jgi:hypothetical protein